MSKDTQMSTKMGPELRDQFMAAADGRYRPAAQIVCGLIRLYIANSEAPNALTADTLRKSRQGEDAFHANSAGDMFK